MMEDEYDPFMPLDEGQRLKRQQEGQALQKLLNIKWRFSEGKLIAQHVESFGNAEIIKQGLKPKNLADALGYQAIPLEQDKPDGEYRLQMSASLAVPFFRAVLQKKLAIVPNEDSETAVHDGLTTNDAISIMCHGTWYDKGDYLESSVSLNEKDAAKCARVLGNHGVENVTLEPAEDDLFRTGQMVLRTPDKKRAALFLMMLGDAPMSISVRPVAANDQQNESKEFIFENHLDHHGDRSFLRMLDIAESRQAVTAKPPSR